MTPAHYCLGFAFDNRGQVLLVRKSPVRGPAVVRGKLNGLGGKVNVGETSRDAMAREFAEEAGITTRADAWRFVARMEFASSGATVDIFAILLLTFADARQGDEPLEAVDVSALARRRDVVHNLPWIVLLCIDEDLSGGDLALTTTTNPASAR